MVISKRVTKNLKNLFYCDGFPLQNEYVHKNLKHVFFYWVGLAIKYRELDHCEEIMNNYLYLQEKLKNSIMIIELGSLFLKQ